MGGVAQRPQTGSQSLSLWTGCFPEFSFWQTPIRLSKSTSTDPLPTLEPRLPTLFPFFPHLSCVGAGCGRAEKRNWTHLCISFSLPSRRKRSRYSLLHFSCVWPCSSYFIGISSFNSHNIPEDGAYYYSHVMDEETECPTWLAGIIQ